MSFVYRKKIMPILVDRTAKQKPLVWEQLGEKQKCCQPLCFRVNQLLQCREWLQAFPLPCVAVEVHYGQHFSSKTLES